MALDPVREANCSFAVEQIRCAVLMRSRFNMRSNNVLALLNVCGKEDVHTNLFKYCIQNSQEFSHAFITSILNWPQETLLTGVYTRMSLPGVGVPDIVLVGNESLRHRLGIVEVKLHADEGHDQTERYASAECIEGICSNLEIENKRVDDFVFLTLYPNQFPQNGSFRPVCMSELLAELVRHPVHDEITSELLLGNWVECLSEFYQCGILKDEDILADKFSFDGQLESGFLAFQQFFSSVPVSGIEARNPWRGNPSGHPYYGISFGKETWAPEYLSCDDSGDLEWSKFNAERNFDIHIECQFDRSQRDVEFLIHYETKPYQSHLKKLASEGTLPIASLDAHMKRRDVFKDCVMDFLPIEFHAARNGSINKIASATLCLDDMSVKNAREAVVSLLSKAKIAIDRSLTGLAEYL
jgi:hypothetical protein